jgi:two-component system sensor histidine kinase KdpD
MGSSFNAALPNAPDPMSPLPAARRAIPWLLTTLACVLTTLLTLPLRSLGLDAVNTVMLYLLTVVLVASKLGRGPSVFAAFLTVALFDFFHVPPNLSFQVRDAQYLLTFAVMLGVALWIAHLTASLRARMVESTEAARRAEALAALARTLAGAPAPEQVQTAVAAFVHETCGARASLWCPDKEEALNPVDAQTRPSVARRLAAIALFHEAPRAAHPARLDDDTQGEVWLWPLCGATRLRGVLALEGLPPGSWAARRPLADAIASLAATALERQHFVDVAHASQMDALSERLRSSILSALSHDIRTPLTALYGQADTLASWQPPLTGAASEMAASIRDQAWRLHDMVSKLLDMARLRSGTSGMGGGTQGAPLPLRREWQPLEEVVGASIQLLGPALARHPVRVDLPPDLPLLCFDAVLMERVFGNLIDNAAQYGTPDGAIRVHAHVQNDRCVIGVRNDGPGFPPGRLDKVFDLFERGQIESAVPGMGLGLAICRAIVEAHGGDIQALNPAEGGAEVRFTLPLGTPPAIEPETSQEADA